MAVRLSYVLSTNVLDQIPVAPGFRIVEMGVPLSWVGKSLAELDVSNRHKVQVIIIKQAVPEQILLPAGRFVLKSSDVMEILGQDEDLRRFQEAVK
jgi:trk system potassium uptake protein TrkA